MHKNMYSPLTQKINDFECIWSFDDKEDYGLLMILPHDQFLIDWWLSVSTMFAHMDIDAENKRTQGVLPFIKIQQVHPLYPEHAVIPEEETTYVGIFYRKEAPLWTIELLIELRKIMSFLNNFAGRKDPVILVNTKEAFDAWLGDNPVVSDFTNDIALIGLDELMKEKIEFFSGLPYGWKIYRLPSIPCQIIGLHPATEEHEASIELRPFGSLIHIFQSTFRVQLKDFEQACVAQTVALFAYPVLR